MNRVGITGLLAIILLSNHTGIASAQTLQPLQDFFDAHCLRCHDDESKKGGLDLTAAHNLKHPETLALFIRLHDRVAHGEMPPGQRKPNASEKAQFLKQLAQQLIVAEAGKTTTVLRRLNRNEYEHTLHDLLGIQTPLAELLPEDGKGHGFDTVGDALDLSGDQLHRYLEAADQAITAATRKSPRPETQPKTMRFSDGRSAQHIGKHWHQLDNGAVVVFNNGLFPPIKLLEFRAPVDGRYRFRIRGFAYQSDSPITFAVYTQAAFRDAGSRFLGYYAVEPGPAKTIEILADVRQNQTLRIMPEISGNYPALMKLGPAKYPHAGLALEAVEIEGPIIAEWPGVGHRLLWGDLPITPPQGKGRTLKPGMIRSDNPLADAERFLERFASAAFRRPVTAAQVAPYRELALAELRQGAEFEQAMRTAYKAILCSPRFLYLIEQPGRLDDYAIASRLSYFLWRSLPDAELLAAAARQELRTPAKLSAQTERMLQDPRSRRFLRDFVGQWLNLRDLEATTPDEKLYPEFNHALLDAMQQETEGFFQEVLDKNLPITEFLDSRWTILNERLAKHYGIPGVRGPEFRRVELPADAHRGGLLTHASILKVSANGTTTSPVTRGAWVLERILGEPPPPPPPGIPGVEPDIRGATTIREQLEKHRTLATCAGCHNKIDPPGFALERYDVIGGWRDRYRAVMLPGKAKVDTIAPVPNRRVALGPAVDATGVTPEGVRFNGPDEYKQFLRQQPDRFARALTEKLAIFATGRTLGFSDRTVVMTIVEQNASANRGLRDLIHRLIQSEIFLTK